MIRVKDQVEAIRDKALSRHNERVLSEITQLRSLRSKQYLLESGNIHLTYSATPIHYQDFLGKYHDIDLSLRRQGRNYIINKAPYEALVFTNRVGWKHTSSRGGWIEKVLVAIDGAPPDLSNLRIEVDENRLYWRNVATGIDIYFEAKPQSTEAFKVASRAYTLTWKITKSPDFKGGFKPAIFGRDAAGDSLEVSGTLSDDIFTEIWTGRVSRQVEKRSRRKEWFTDPKLPVLVDATINEDVVLASDDAHESGYNPGVVYLNSTSMTVGNFYGNAGYWAGVRFQSLAIPVGATITDADLTIITTAISGYDAPVKVYGDDQDDPSTWGSSDSPKDVTPTTANTPYTLLYANVGTPNVIDVTSIIAEIVARPGWASGNDLRLVIWPNGNYPQGVKTYDDSPANAPQLDVTYSTSVNTTVTPGKVDIVTSPFAPIIKHGIVVPKVDLTDTHFVPVIALGLVIPKIDLTTTKFAPTVVNPQGMAVPKVDLTTTKYAPVLQSSIIVPLKTLTTSLFAPSLALVVIPPALALSDTHYAPVVTLSGSVTPGVVNLVTTAFEPVIGLKVIPDKIDLLTTRYAPGLNLSIIPGVVNLSDSQFAPVVTTTSHTLVIPDTKALVTTLYEPFIGNPKSVVPETLGLVIVTFEPVLLTVGMIKRVQHASGRVVSPPLRAGARIPVRPTLHARFRPNAGPY